MLKQEAIQAQSAQVNGVSGASASSQAFQASLAMPWARQNKMKKHADIMGMPVIIQVIDASVTEEDIGEVFSYFHFIDKKFSTYKEDSEIAQINRGELKPSQFSNEMKKNSQSFRRNKKRNRRIFRY